MPLIVRSCAERKLTVAIAGYSYKRMQQRMSGKRLSRGHKMVPHD
jgi:hypothetical protein